MFPSNNNGNYNDPFPYIDPPLSFFHFPSPYYNQCEFELQEYHDVFLNQHHQALTDHNSVSEYHTIINMPDSSKNDTQHCTKISNNGGGDHQQKQKVVLVRKRSKKDRHSKINTAKGPRDRRMRLSLDVARHLFGLQDMLGFDKASKTIEWLLKQAEQEIKNLKLSRSYSPSSTSEGEVVSGIDNKPVMEGSSSSKGKPSKKVRSQPRETGFRPHAKDLREKARARAKARTSAKIMSTQRITNNPSSQAVVAEVKEFGPRSDDELMRIINRWSPNSTFSCLQNAGTNQFM